MPSSSVGRAAAAAPDARHARGRRRQRERHELAPDEPGGALVGAPPRDAERRTRAARASSSAARSGRRARRHPSTRRTTRRPSRPACSTRFTKIAAVAFAFSCASGHENATRASPAQPAWWQSSALYVSVAGVPRTSVIRTRSSPRSSKLRGREVGDDVGREVRAPGRAPRRAAGGARCRTLTRPPDAAGFVITAVPSASTSAIGYGRSHGCGHAHQSPAEVAARGSGPSTRAGARRGSRPRAGPSRPTPSRARARAARGTAPRRRPGR